MDTSINGNEISAALIVKRTDMVSWADGKDSLVFINSFGSSQPYPFGVCSSVDQ